jgi:hypothetical protein
MKIPLQYNHNLIKTDFPARFALTNTICATLLNSYQANRVLVSTLTSKRGCRKTVTYALTAN